MNKLSKNPEDQLEDLIRDGSDTETRECLKEKNTSETSNRPADEENGMFTPLHQKRSRMNPLDRATTDELAEFTLTT